MNSNRDRMINSFKKYARSIRLILDGWRKMIQKLLKNGNGSLLKWQKKLLETFLVIMKMTI